MEGRESIAVTYDSNIYVGNISKFVVFTDQGMRLTASEFSEDADTFNKGDKVYINWIPERAVMIRKQEDRDE